MPQSKVNPTFEFNESKWVVSLINTGDKLGGHAKIIVEGITTESIKKTENHTFFSKDNNSNLFVAEYHIMEALEANEQFQENPKYSHIPQFLKNTQCKYVIRWTERDYYKEDKGKQYSQSHSQSWYTPPEAVWAMIKDIKEESQRCDNREQDAEFQYAGKWCLYSYNGGHNCTTWAEEKLAIAGVGNGIIKLDSIKAIPEVHVSNWKGCTII